MAEYNLASQLIYIGFFFSNIHFKSNPLEHSLYIAFKFIDYAIYITCICVILEKNTVNRHDKLFKYLE